MSNPILIKLTFQTGPIEILVDNFFDLLLDTTPNLIANTKTFKIKEIIELLIFLGPEHLIAYLNKKLNLSLPNESFTLSAINLEKTVQITRSNYKPDKTIIQFDHFGRILNVSNLNKSRLIHEFGARNIPYNFINTKIAKFHFVKILNKEYCNKNLKPLKSYPPYNAL